MLCSLVVPIVQTGSSLPACPHLSPLRIRGKGAFCPACAHRCVSGQGCAPWIWGCIHSPERLRPRKLALKCFRISRSLSLWISSAVETTWSLTGRRRERAGFPVGKRHPVLGLSWGRAGSVAGAAHPLYPGRLIPVETSPVPQHYHTRCVGWKKFFPPSPDKFLGVKGLGAGGSGCQIPGGRSGRVRGGSIWCPPPYPGPALQLGLYRASGWSCARRSGSCWCSSPRMSRSCGTERSDGANTPPNCPN